jgi:hypothetical protein
VVDRVWRRAARAQFVGNGQIVADQVALNARTGLWACRNTHSNAETKLGWMALQNLSEMT